MSSRLEIASLWLQFAAQHLSAMSSLSSLSQQHDNDTYSSRIDTPSYPCNLIDNPTSELAWTKPWCWQDIHVHFHCSSDMAVFTFSKQFHKRTCYWRNWYSFHPESEAIPKTDTNVATRPNQMQHMLCYDYPMRTKLMEDITVSILQTACLWLDNNC